MTILMILSIALNVTLIYALLNLVKKNELYEQAIQEFYSRVSITLHNMRIIDERQMFESDDEVGSVFEQLTDVVNDLRPLLYGAEDDGNRNNSQTNK